MPGPDTIEPAMALALRALIWTLQSPSRAERLLALTGLSVEELRGGAGEPGVLAAVAGIFGDHAVSIRSMEQVGLGAEARLVFITHTAREAAMQATLHDLRGLSSVRRVGDLVRVVGAAS